MKIIRLLSLFFLACTITLGPLAFARAPAPLSFECGCEDFLATLDIKPPHVVFVKCEPHKDRQGKPLTATYRVPGVHAAKAEAFLIRVAHMSKLKRSCCQWDGLPGQFTGKDGHAYTIYMVSPDTGVKSRKQWRNIDHFEIVVEALTEDI